MSVSWWLVILVLGLILSFIGFGLRARDGGVLLIGLGFLAALAALVYKAIVTFG
ncbi:MAG: hypothetical protein M0R28_12400 [Pigmentiphaga sp.]|nr:hypothetical protein [Pigmentiphaga sp.]